jgi:Uncharacterized protein involved in copper resistance
MTTNRRPASRAWCRPVWLTALLLALPLAALAQTVPASSSSTPTMDMGALPGMAHGAMPGMAPASAAPGETSGSMHGMDHSAMPGMSHAGMPGMQHDEAAHAMHGGMQGMPGMTMGPMQGGHAPPDARSPDYSDGVGYGDMTGMERHDAKPLGMLLIDRLEAFHGRDANGQSWEAQCWYGSDSNKLWVRTEGERSGGRLEDGDVEAFWSHAVATYWNSQLGVRQDFGEGPKRTWAAFGVQGLAPYWFELEATGYIGANGRTAARLRADYELLFTQRLILQPEAEVNLYGKDDPQRRIGSGVSDVQFGLRLRYEFHRQFAPYIGVNWIRRVGTTADYARQYRQPVLDRQIVAGVRIWF